MGFLDKLLHRTAPAETPAAPPPTPEAVAIPTATMVPRYPSPGLAVPSVSAAQLVAAQEDLIRQLVQTLGLSRSERAKLLDPVIEQFASYVHLLPASETHHHCGIGGLLRHGLEVAFYAARFTEGIVFGMDLPPERRHAYVSRARLGTAIAGMLHDLGKPLVDIGVMEPLTGQLWNPHVEPLTRWLERGHIARYTIYWRPGARHRRHEAFGPMLIHRILGPDVLAFLADGDGRDILDQMVLAVGSATTDARHPLFEAVKRGDQASVALDLERQGAQTSQAAGGSARSMAMVVLRTMQSCVRDGSWIPNIPGNPVWCTTQGIFLLAPEFAMMVIQRVLDEGISSLPAHPETLIASLLDARLVDPYQASPESLVSDTWPVTIDVSNGKQSRTMAVRAVRLARADLLFGDEPLPPPLPAAVGEGAALAPPAPVPTQPAPRAKREKPAPTDASAQESNEEQEGRPPMRDGGDPSPAPGSDEEPVIRARRDEIDPAEKKLKARADASKAPETAEASLAWLDKHAPIGEFLKSIVASVDFGQQSNYDGTHYLVAFPKPFEGHGVSVARLAGLLLEHKWILPDPSTPDRATVTAAIGRHTQLAIRFTPQLSRIMSTLVAGAPPAPQVPEAPIGKPETLPLFGMPAAEVTAPSLAGEPDLPAGRTAFRKLRFYDYLTSRYPGVDFHSMTKDLVLEELGRFARFVRVPVEVLQADLSAEPNRMLRAETWGPVAAFSATDLAKKSGIE